MFLQKLLEDFRHFSGRYLREKRIMQIGVLEQFEDLATPSIVMENYTLGVQ